LEPVNLLGKYESLQGTTDERTDCKKGPARTHTVEIEIPRGYSRRPLTLR